jgi:hypothetical protein
MLIEDTFRSVRDVAQKLHSLTQKEIINDIKIE